MDHLFVNIPSSIQAPPQTPLPLLDQQNPSWSTVIDRDDYDDDFPDTPGLSAGPKKARQIRRRSSKGVSSMEIHSSYCAELKLIFLSFQPVINAVNPSVNAKDTSPAMNLAKIASSWELPAHSWDPPGSVGLPKGILMQ